MTQTLGNMLTRIGSEINRTDIDSNIYDAVISAIAFYEPYQFYFNQATTTVTTTSDQRYTAISGITDFVYPLSLRVTDSASQYRLLEPMTFSEMEGRYLTDSSTGNIYYYSVFAERFYWWLIPNAAFTVTVNYIKSLTRPSGSTDTSYATAWMNDAEAMIRSKAKFYIYADVLRNNDKAQKFEAISQREKQILDQKTTLRSYNSQIMGWI